MTASSVPAVRAADLVASLGVNTHIDFGGTYANLTTVEANIKYLGVQNLRDSFENPSDLTTWLNVGNATGVKFDDYIPETSVSGMSTWLAYVPQLAKEGVLNFVEGGNEEDDSYPASLGNTVAATATFQQQVYAAAQAAGLPSINMSFGAGWSAANNWHGDYDKVGDLSAYATYGNAHTYPNYPNGAPDASIQQLNADAKLAASSRAVITTEIGWDESQGFTQANVAKYVLDASLDGLKDGNPKTYFYALYDDGSGKFGLMNADGTAKPAGTALHNLTTLLADTGATASSFATDTLSYTLAGTQATDSSMMLEKSDGSHWLALWNEGETAGAPHTVTLSLSAAANIVMFDPLAGTSSVQSASNAKTFAIGVPDHPVLVEIVGSAGTTTTTTTTPATTAPATTTTTTAPATGTLSPAPSVVLPTAAPSLTVGTAGAISGVSLSDAWAAKTPGTLGLNLSVDQGSFSIRNAGGTLLSGSAVSLTDTLANLNADLASLQYTGGAVGTAHLTVDLWDQAGVENTKTLAVTVAAAPPATLSPNPSVVLPTTTPTDVAGKAAQLAGVSLSDPWAASVGGTGGLNLYLDQGSLGLKTVGGATVTANAASSYAAHVADSLANLNADLKTMTFTGAKAGTAHVTVDYWDQAGKESTRVLAVNVTTAAAAPAATPATLATSLARPSFVAGASQAAATTIVMPKAGAAPVTLTPDFAAGTVLDFSRTLATSQWDGLGADLSHYIKVGVSGHDATVSVDPSGAVGGAATMVATLTGQAGATLATLAPHAIF